MAAGAPSTRERLMREVSKDGLSIEFCGSGKDWIKVYANQSLSDYAELTFGGPAMQREKQTYLVRALFQVPGIARIVLGRYDMEIHIGRLFSCKKIMGQVEREMFDLHKAGELNKTVGKYDEALN